MKLRRLTTFVVMSALASAAMAAQFGSDKDLRDAAELWKAMEKARLVGKVPVISTPYQGVHPHGMFLDTIDTRITVSGHEGTVIIKRNYGGEGVGKAQVADDPARYLQAVTVMFRREKGYDKENLDWFWVKYDPKGAVMKNPAGIPLAGRVGKGEKEGCIPCHRDAPGNDMVYNNNRHRLTE